MLSLSRNLVSCYGVSCRIEELALLYGAFSGGVAIDDLLLESNSTYCSGSNCLGAEVFSVGFGGVSSLRNGNIVANRSKCEGHGCLAGFGGAVHNGARTLTISDATFAFNETDGFGAAAF